MALRIGVLGDTAAEVQAEMTRLMRHGYKPDGPVTDRLAGGGWMGRARRVCGIHRYDEHDLPLPELCGRHPRHPDPGPGCGDWEPDLSVCTACGRNGTDHLRDYMRFNPTCTAWPPEDD